MKYPLIANWEGTCSELLQFESDIPFVLAPVLQLKPTLCENRKMQSHSVFFP